MGGQAFHQGIRPGALDQGNPEQYDYATIAGYLEQAQPAELGGVAEAYAMVQRALGEAEGGLGKHVQRLNMIWKGGAKELGIADMRLLTEATRALSTASGKFSAAMHSGYTAVKVSQHSMPPTSAPLGTLPGKNPTTKLADDKAAQQHLATTNANLTSAFDQIPASVTFDLPMTGKGSRKFGGSPSEPPTGGLPGSTGTAVPSRGGAGSTGIAETGKEGSSAPEGSIPHRGTGGRPALLSGGGSLPAPVTNELLTAGGSSGGDTGSHLAAVAPASDRPSDTSPRPSGSPGLGPNGSATPPSLPVGPDGPLPSLPADDAYGPRPPGQTSPVIGGKAQRIPHARIPENGHTPGARIPQEQMRTAGVIGRTGHVGVRVISPSSAGSINGIEPASRLPSDGVLRGGHLSAEEAGNPEATSRYGTKEGTSGIPLGSAAGGGARNGERTREVQLVEETDLWKDETAVAPQVIGGTD